MRRRTNDPSVPANSRLSGRLRADAGLCGGGTDALGWRPLVDAHESYLLFAVIQELIHSVCDITSLAHSLPLSHTAWPLWDTVR
jgi:hypothetical protein